MAIRASDRSRVGETHPYGSNVRTATADDVGALATLEERTYVEALGHLFAPHPYPSGDVLARWALVLADPTVTVLGAWDGERLCGYAAFDDTSLRHLAVAPELFGTGLAGALHNRALRAWRSAGAQEVYLWVLAENRRARRFYERRGWTPDGRSQSCPWAPYPSEVGYRRDPHAAGAGR